MNQRKILSIVVGVVIAIIMVYSFSGGQTTEEYIEEILEEREEADIFMKNNSDSPFKDSEVKYEGLKYYEPNIKYKITARFTKADPTKIVKLGTNDGAEREYLTYGKAEFSFADKAQTLLILESVEDKKLFLAFGDETSAIETYGAGRYLDVTHSGGNTIVLDFNLAYNPYCAYADGFSCPLPPRENLLSVAIEAGEKTYQ
ncbi:MAG: DUF1684 domain-containing protein [Fulvivirga sp.]